MKLDRLDLMILASGSMQAPAPRPVVRAYVPPPPPPKERQPVITSTRGPRFVDHTTCPLCGIDRIGVEYHGQLMPRDGKPGANVHQLFAHSPGRRMVGHGQPRCLGAGMRVVFEGGAWKGAAS